MLETAACQDVTALQDAIERAQHVCLMLNIPIPAHFRRVHVHGLNGAMDWDWALSELSFYLLLLNGNACNTAVAQARA